MGKSDDTEDSNDEGSPNMNPKSKTISHQCKICGVPALHSNYGAITCYPCKMFFKRNVTIKKKQLHCNFHNQCEINVNNRHICSSCRLAKCFASGMQADLIRCPIPKKTNANKNQHESIIHTSKILTSTTEKIQSEPFPITNLLQRDNSILTINQWTLLSNLINSYDEKQLLLIAQQFINKYDNSQLIDSNLSNEFFSKIYEITGTYIRSNRDFCTLNSDDRYAFLRNIAENVTCLGRILTWNQSQIYNCKPFMYIHINFHGENSVIMIKRVLKFIDPDIIIAKLALSLFAFSNNISMFSSHIRTKTINTLAIIHIQNIYAEIIWRYLIYRYGYYQSVQRFNNIIQCLLAATNAVYDAQNSEKHVNDIESFVEQTELTLMIDDIEPII